MGPNRLHPDEEGTTTLQVVCLIAVAFVILGLIRWFWSDIKNWVAISLGPVFGF